MTAYDDARVEGAKTLGDAYRHHRRDPDAFVAGAQYALDAVLAEQEHRLAGLPLSATILDRLAAGVLEQAKAGDPL